MSNIVICFEIGGFSTSLPLRKKRGIIESVNDILMTLCDIDHTRHRSPMNAVAHIYAGVAAYTYLDKLPTLFAKKNQMM